MLIRTFHPHDQDAVRRLILEGLGEHFGFIDETMNPDLDNIQKCYVETGARVLVAEDNGVIVGTGSLLQESDNEGRIVRMSTAQTHRRKGVGSRLFDALICAAKDQGMQSVVIATEPHWKDAVGFYRSRGCIPYGNDDVDVFMRLDLRLKSNP